MDDQPAPTPTAAATPIPARIDLHCHSRYSSSNRRYLSTRLGLQECYTDPHVVYRQAKSRRMTHVTLTDVDSIDGALRLAEHSAFVMGEEVSAFFPSEAVFVHLLVWGLDEAQHAVISELRYNIFELTEYLRAEGLAYGLAHPTSSAAGELRPEHIELLMLLVPLWETRNGGCTPLENRLANDLVARSAELLPRLAEKHGREPVAGAVRGFAGSDDHSALDIGRTYTRATLEGPEDTLTAALSRRLYPRGAEGSLTRSAHTVAALFLKGGDPQDSNWVLRTVRRRALRSPALWGLAETRRGQQLAGGLLGFAADLPWRREKSRPPLRRAAISEAAEAMRAGGLLGNDFRHDRMVDVIEGAWERSMRSQIAALRRFDVRDGERRNELLLGLAQTQAFLAPYLAAGSGLARQRRHAAALARDLSDAGLAAPLPRRGEPRVAMFTDTLNDINGVAAVLRPLIAHADAHDWPFTMVSCAAEARSDPHHEAFAYVDRFGFEFYREFPIYLPPVIPMLLWCERQDVDIVHAATPGPVGLAAALIARVLDKRLVATYHTDLPRLGFHLTGDHIIRETLWSWVRFFYGSCETVYCPSVAVQHDLAEHGVRTRFAPFDQGVDPEQFSPRWRDMALNQRLGGNRTVLLWVGRVSPEKGLDLLAEAYNRLRVLRDDVQLVIVGDGPYRQELERLAPTAVFLGYLRGDELSATFASADIFVFPGRNETFGQVVLEAAAAELPSVVVAGPGVDENVLRDETALVVAPGDVAGFVTAVVRLLDDPELRARMGRAARERAARRTWPESYERLRASYGELLDRDDPFAAG